MQNRYRNILKIGGLTMALFMLAACGHISSFRQNGAGKSLDSRVEALWTAKKEGRLYDAYQFYCADFRKARSAEEFVRAANLEVLEFSIEEIQLAEGDNAARVTVRFHSTVQGFDLKNIRVTEDWKKEGGKWYACQKLSHPQSIIKSK